MVHVPDVRREFCKMVKGTGSSIHKEYGEIIIRGFLAGITIGSIITIICQATFLLFLILSSI